MKLPAVYIAIVALGASKCGPAGPEPVVPSASPASSVQPPVDPLKLLSERLREPGWAQQLDPFKDTSPIPQAGGLEYMPEQALGHVWAVSIKKNLDASKTCMNTGVGPNASADTEIVPLGRFLVADGKKCRVKPVGEQKVYEFRVEGGAAAKTAIGPFLDGSGQADRAFEVLITHPTHVTVENQADCIAEDQLRRLNFAAADRICAVYWVHTVKQTKIHSRAFSKVTGELQGGFSVIKLGGSVYSSSEEMKAAMVITGNHSVITHYMDRDGATGYVVKSATKKLAVNIKPEPVDPLVGKFLETKTDKEFKVELVKEVPVRLAPPQ